MKKLFLLSAALVLMITSFSASTPVEKPAVKAASILIPIGNTGNKISLLDLSRISVKDVQLLTGKKMNFVDRITFKAAQKKLKSSINNDGTLNSKRLSKNMKKADIGSGFHIGGFALGFLLGLIGVLIAYLINDDKKSTRVKWAWLGLAAWIVILILLVI